MASQRTGFHVNVIAHSSGIKAQGRSCRATRQSTSGLLRACPGVSRASTAASPSSNGRGHSSSASARAGFTLTIPMGVGRRPPGVDVRSTRDQFVQLPDFPFLPSASTDKKEYALKTVQWPTGCPLLIRVSLKCQIQMKHQHKLIKRPLFNSENLSENNNLSYMN